MLAHHVLDHTLDWEQLRPLQEIEADQLAGSIMARLDVPLETLGDVMTAVVEDPTGAYPPAAMRRAALVEGWTATGGPSGPLYHHAYPTGDDPADDLPAGDVPPPAYRNGDDDTYPTFWPPPQASGLAVLSLPALRGGGATLGDVAAELESALDATGYYDRAYYAVPDGFALVARLEQIHDDGTPLDPPDRWSLDVKPMRRFSLSAYFRALFTATPGHFRIVAFVVTSHPLTQQSVGVAREEALAWLDEGMNVLPPEIARLPVSDEHACTALIYSFEKPSLDLPVRFVDPSPLPARIHLERAGLWSELQ